MKANHVFVVTFYIADAVDMSSLVRGYPVVRKAREAHRTGHQLVFLLTRLLGVNRGTRTEFQLYSVFSIKSSF